MLDPLSGYLNVDLLVVAQGALVYRSPYLSERLQDMLFETEVQVGRR